MPTLTIDNQRVTAPDGATILEAARGAGIHIPTLCHHPDLSNVGACRMCVVSVEKAQRRADGLHHPGGRGHGGPHRLPDAIATRKFVLEMLLSDHPNECMTCEVNGDCELQDLVYDYDVAVAPAQRCAPHLPHQPGPQSLRLHRPQQVHPVRPLRASLRRDPEPRRVELRLPRLRDQAGGRRRPVDAGCALRELRPVRRLLPHRRAVRQDERGQGPRRPGHAKCAPPAPSAAWAATSTSTCATARSSASPAPPMRQSTAWPCASKVATVTIMSTIRERLTRPLVRAKWLDPAEVERQSGEWQVAGEGGGGTQVAE